MANRSKWYQRLGSKEKGFYYVDASGKRLRDKELLERFRALVIPPAWTEVRISPSPNSKVQVVGNDTAGRLQYLYHESFRERQQKKKFSKLLAFAERLPFLRKRARKDLRKPELSKDRVLAVVIRLIDDLYFRVGSEKSVEQYKTFGVTTLRSKHIKIFPDDEIEFDFVGKHHIQHKLRFRDPELVAILRELKALRGSKLFKYVTPEGKIKPITARDVNDYIKRSTASEFSAKDFRTWGATVKAAEQLSSIGSTKGERSIKKNIIRAVKAVAERLGNTIAVARNSYIHPAILKKYEKGVTLEKFEEDAEKAAKKPGSEIDKDEAAVIAMLKS